MAESPKTYSSIFAYAIAINYVIGTGVFSIPHAVVQSGYLLALIILTAYGIFAALTLQWVLECMSRAETVLMQRDKDASGAINEPLLRAEHGDGGGGGGGGVDATPLARHTIRFRALDYTRMFAVFYGPRSRYACQLAISLYCIGVLWAFAAVFASSTNSLFFQFVFTDRHCDIYGRAANNDPHCRAGEVGMLAAYAVIVVPMSLLDMTEQRWVQLSLTTFRFTAFGVMLVTTSVALLHGANPFAAADQDAHVAYRGLFDVAGFKDIFTALAVATLFHYNLPDLVKPVRHKQHMTRIVIGALVTALIFYVVLGALAAALFGAHAKPLITLNWSAYTGRGGGWGGAVAERPWWAVAVQLWVMLFPIFDMVSVFPLVAVSLANNGLQTLPPAFTAAHPRRARLLCRLLSAVPPIIAAGALGRLDQIFLFTGAFAFILEMIFPALLQYRSKQVAGAVPSVYSNLFSHNAFVAVTFVFGVASLAVYLVVAVYKVI